MNYPTIEEIDTASRLQICKWYRFLKSPGTDVIGKPDFDKVLKEEGILLQRIRKRFYELGGFTPEISKALGWSNND